MHSLWNNNTLHITAFATYVTDILNIVCHCASSVGMGIKTQSIPENYKNFVNLMDEMGGILYY